MFYEEKRNPSLISLLITVLVGIAIVAYMIPLLATGDPGWFLSGATVQPARFIVWSGGKQISIAPGDPDFAAINAEVERALNHVVAYTDFGPSPETLEATRNGLALEVIYAEPVAIHTQWNLGKPTRLMFPLSGPYLPDRRFFLGQDDRYRAGGPQVDDVNKLVSLVSALVQRRSA